MSLEDAISLEEDFDKWDDRERREKFIRRMEHKLNYKESRSDRR